MSHSYLKCPACGADATSQEPYDIGSGPELSCPLCECCWGAEGQPLKPLDPAILRLGHLLLSRTAARNARPPEGESQS